MKNIYSKSGTLLAVIFNDIIENKRIDLSPSNEIIQVGLVPLGKGKIILPHFHMPIKRETLGTQEVWVIMEGIVEITIFDLDTSTAWFDTLNSGNCMVFFRGGHSFKVVSDNAIIYEIKNGPYYGNTADTELVFK